MLILKVFKNGVAFTGGLRHKALCGFGTRRAMVSLYGSSIAFGLKRFASDTYTSSVRERGIFSYASVSMEMWLFLGFPCTERRVHLFGLAPWIAQVGWHHVR